jgi:cytochrome c553
MLGRRLVPLLAAVCGVLAISLARAGAQSPSPSPPDLERGRHLATAVAGCADCHGADFAGGRGFARGGLTVYAANLTGGAGGIAAQTDAQIARALRSGIAADGRQLRVMPWREYAIMTDADVADVIAFLRSLPPVDRTVPSPPPMPASAAAAPPGPAASNTDDVVRPLSGGAYLATIGGCLGCHGAALAGGNQIGGIVTPNISHDGIGSWTFADFRTAMRTGMTPGGHRLAMVMPWRSAGQMTDTELQTLYDFLESKSSTPS